MTGQPDAGPALVFGAGGFIGRWVVRELVQRGRRVVGVVRDDAAGRAAFGSWSSALQLLSADLAVAGAGERVIEDARPSVVFNLAGYGVDRRERDDHLADRLNHRLVTELAVSCARGGASGAPRLIHVGSALEYGTAGGTLSEATPPQPTTLYGRTKLAGTQAIGDAARMHGTLAMTARLFTVFGDGEHDGRLFPSLVDAARSGAVVPLTDGRQSRDFAWAGDVAALLVDLSSASFHPGEVVNLASGTLHTVAVFVRECARQLGLTNQQLQFGALPTRPEEMLHDGVDVERLRALTGRTAIGDLSTAIAHALATRLSGW